MANAISVAMTIATISLRCVASIESPSKISICASYDDLFSKTVQGDAVVTPDSTADQPPPSRLERQFRRCVQIVYVWSEGDAV